MRSGCKFGFECAMYGEKKFSFWILLTLPLYESKPDLQLMDHMLQVRFSLWQAQTNRAGFETACETVLIHTKNTSANAQVIKKIYQIFYFRGFRRD